MKKLTSLLLILSLAFAVFSFASCGEADKESGSPYDNINSAITNTRNLDKFSCTVSTEITGEAMGYEVNLPRIRNITYDMSDPDSVVILAETTITEGDGSSTVQIYCEADWMWVYFSSDGSGYRIQIDKLKSVVEYSQFLSNIIQTLPTDVLDDCVLTDNGDGSQSINLKLAPKKFMDVYNDAISSLVSDVVTVISNKMLNLDDATVSVTIADEYVAAYSLEFSIAPSVFGLTADCSVKATVEYNAIGDDVAITPPEGYLDFQLISEDLILQGLNS